MNGEHYEELCRSFLAAKLGLPIEDIESTRIANPKRGKLPQYSHQIDLFWESNDAVSQYVNIANAKWRGDRSVEQGEILLLQQVKTDVSAHKAVMITSKGFTAGALAAAKDKGIALYVVQPAFDTSLLAGLDRTEARGRLGDLARGDSESLFHVDVVHRAFEWTGNAQQATSGGPVPPPSYSTRVVAPTANRAVSAPANRGMPSKGSRSSGPGSTATTKGPGRQA